MRIREKKSLPEIRTKGVIASIQTLKHCHFAQIESG